jgi:hypothetical protein
MSTLRVNKIVNLNDNGPVEFSQGATIPSGKTLTGDLSVNTSGTVSATTLSATTITASGTVTANAFSGNGSGLTSVPGLPTGKAIALTFIA